MSRSWRWLVYALLVGLAGLASWRAGEHERTGDLPSTANGGPRGARALFRYLEARGYAVRPHHESLLRLPNVARTFVISAPSARDISSEEVEAISRFVEAGGTLVYLAPRPLLRTQPAMRRWLGLPGRGEATSSEAHPSIGPVPETLRSERKVVSVRDPLERWSKLSVRKAAGFDWTQMGALPLAADEDAGEAGLQKDAFLLYMTRGKGEIYIGAGPDLIENDGISEADNVVFWEVLAARGPMLFDEFHHRADAVPVPASLLAVAGQCVLVFLAFVWMKGTRLGPPRPIIEQRHRSMREYLETFAAMAKRAKVEQALLEASWLALRRTLHERTIISTYADDEDVAERLERARKVPRDDYLTLARAVREALGGQTLAANDYVRLTRQIAELEQQVAGVSASAHRRRG